MSKFLTFKLPNLSHSPLLFIGSPNPHFASFPAHKNQTLHIDNKIISRHSWQAAMGFTAKQMAFAVAILGLVSFVLGVLAENNKPPSGTPIPGKGVVICNYPSDPSVVLGSLSFVFLVAATAVGFVSLFYPYEGHSIPQYIMFKDSTFIIFFNITVFTTGLGAALLLWPIIQERNQLNNKVHHDPNTTCPTAKTGLLGGGAFLSLDSALLWLVTLMLATNVREDYFDEAETGFKNGMHSQVISFDS